MSWFQVCLCNGSSLQAANMDVKAIETGIPTTGMSLQKKDVPSYFCDVMYCNWLHIEQ